MPILRLSSLAAPLRAWPLLLLAACAPPGREEPAPVPAELRWRALPGAPTIRGKQDDLFFVSRRLGWSVNGQGSIFRTRDAGESWERVLHRPGTYFRAVAFLDSLRGFAGNIGPGYYPGVTDSVALYRTRDGGRTWSPVTRIRGPYPKGICNFHVAPDGRTVWAAGRVGGPSFLLVSRDGGESWESRDLSDRLGVLIDVHFPTPERGFLVGGSAADPRRSRTVLLATADGGATWTEAFRSRDSLELGWKFAFPTERTGYVSVLALDSTSTFLKTGDGGRSWREHPLVPGPYQAKGVGFIDEELGWMAGERPGVPAYRTADGGRTWQPDTTLGPLVNRFRFVRGRRGRLEAGYAIGATIHRLDPAPR